MRGRVVADADHHVSRLAERPFAVAWHVDDGAVEVEPFVGLPKKLRQAEDLHHAGQADLAIGKPLHHAVVVQLHSVVAHLVAAVVEKGVERGFRVERAIGGVHGH